MVFGIIIASFWINHVIVSRKCLSKAERDSRFTVKTNFQMNPDYYTADSLLIVYTIMEMREKGGFLLSNPFDEGLLDQFTTFVDTIFYSPDTLKLISLIVERAPCNIGAGYPFQERKENCFYFNGFAFIGYRESPKTQWNLYVHDQCRASSFGDYKTVINLLREYFLDNILICRGVSVPDRKGNYVYRTYNYNIDEFGFWDSIVWQKGVRDPGLYLFQFKFQSKEYMKGDTTAIPYFPISYPDSLIKHYSK